MKKLTKLALAFLFIVGLSSCGANNNSQPANTNEASPEETDVAVEPTPANETGDVIRIGVVGENNEVWEEVIKRYEAGTGKKAELVRFADYTQPNEALSSGDIDVNSFQHYKYLEEYNTATGSDLVAIGDTMLAPLGLYSSQITSLDELEDGARIAIPNDPSNGSRALFLLQAAGLITVEGNAGETITLAEITDNPKNLEFIEMDASQTPRSLDDVTAAVVNDNYALDAGLKPNQDAVYLEDPNNPDVKQYINVIATRKADENNEAYKELVSYYQTDETKKDYDTYTDGAWIPSW